MKRSSNRRWVVVMVPRSGAIEVFGLFNTRELAWEEMDSLTRAEPHRYKGAKISQVRQPPGRAGDR